MDTIALKDAPVARPRLSVRALVGIAVLAAFTILITWRARVLEEILERQSKEPALVSQPAPEFSASTLDGQTVSLKDFRGRKRVVLSFWASWCGPCRLEMPGLIEFYKRNHNDSSDFELLAISIDEDPKNAAEFATAQKLNFPVLLDPQQKIAQSYQVDGIPTMLIVDKDGKVTYGHIGYDMMMSYSLSRELGIKKKMAEEGATDGSAGH
jgi:peroxiredoxin